MDLKRKCADALFAFYIFCCRSCFRERSCDQPGGKEDIQMLKLDSVFTPLVSNKKCRSNVEK